MLLLLLACTSSVPDSDPPDQTVPGVGTLEVFALSPDEISATVNLPEAGTLSCGDVSRDIESGPQTAYLAGLSPGSTSSCSATGPHSSTSAVEVTLPSTTTMGVVLFDAAHGQQSGNADWVIDDNMPNPSPSKPSSAEAWTGAYSSFGYDLLQAGYSLRSNTGSLSADRLADVQVLVVPEPNTRFSETELAAIGDFVQAGGGLLVISNHHTSDRNNDGVEPTAVADTLLEAAQASTRQTDESHDVLQENNTTSFAGDPHDPVLHGRHGDVSTFAIYEGSAFTVSGLPGDRAVLWIMGHLDEPERGARVVAAYPGAGRVLCVPDSAAADDGSANPGNDAIYDAWTEDSNAAFFLNAVDWLANVRG